MELRGLGLVDDVGVVVALDGLVGRDLDDVELVDLHKLVRLGEGGTGHTGELIVHAEEVLEGDRGERLALPLDLDPLLGLDGLVQALVVAAAKHQAAGELVHDDDLAVLDHIVHIPLHDAPGPDGLVDVVVQGGVLRVGEVLDVEIGLRLGNALGGQGDVLSLLLHDIVGVGVLILELFVVGLGDTLALQAGHKPVHLGVQRSGLLPLAGDDQGGAGLIDEDRVHLVHDGKALAPLDQIPVINGHIVP